MSFSFEQQEEMQERVSLLAHDGILSVLEAKREVEFMLVAWVETWVKQWCRMSSTSDWFHRRKEERKRSNDQSVGKKVVQSEQ